jgi:hypothetical protein
MPAPIIPWEPSNIPSEIQEELRRRSKNRSFNYKPNNIASWDKTGNWNQYKGPMTSWVRICSNGRGRKNKDGRDLPRFVFRGGKDFYQTYGFQPLSKVSGQQVIGYTPSGEKHIIENSLITHPNDVSGNPNFGNHPIHVATPEVSRLEVMIQKELYRRATFEWVCFSWKQLEYMAPYFLVPGLSVMIEWGWNHFNPASLFDLTNVDGKEPNMKSLWNDSYPLYFDNILLSKGNYDVVYGIITNFNWSVEGNKIVCSTEITSKDRLYAGIAKNSTLKVRTTEKDSPPEFLMSMRNFFQVATPANLKCIATSQDPLNEALNLSKTTISKQEPTTGTTSTSTTGKGVNNQVLYDIVKGIVAKDSETKKTKLPYLYGMFWGRKKDDGSFYKVATPKESDFDGGNESPTPDRFWMNMGMVVEILNKFIARPGVNGKNMFEVDISTTVINAHPNLISIDPRVLIPNYQAPKYHWGMVGRVTNGGAGENIRNPEIGQSASSGSRTITTYKPGPTTNFGFVGASLAAGGGGSIITTQTQKKGNPAEYIYQYTKPQKAGNLPDETIGKVLYQFKSENNHSVYRNDLDSYINWYRYNVMPTDVFGKESLDFSFPAKSISKIKPITPRKKDGKVIDNDYVEVEKDYSGLLSNVYLSLEALKSVVESDDIKTIKDVYDKICEILNESVDQFWDLAVTEGEGTLVIMDRKRIPMVNFKSQDNDPLWIFDYYASDSLIKSLRFRPALSDAQATRAIYGEVNNPNAKYSSPDPNDLLRFYFKDDVVLPEDYSASGKSMDDLNSQNSTQEQLKMMLTPLQVIDNKDFKHLQMTVPSPKGIDEVIKLCLPDPDILRLMLMDGDTKNNPNYCAIQPGITCELTLLGIGGLRTFQYFSIRNLPEPYSHKNIIFRITDVHQTIEAGNWETTIRAGLIPLTEYIKLRITPEGGWDDYLKPST